MTSSPGAVLLEDYNVNGTLGGGNLELGPITVGNGGSITATTDPTLGIYDVSTGTYGSPAGQGSESIVPDSSTSSTDLLSAGANGTVNLFANEQAASVATFGIGESTTDPITVSAGHVNVIDNTGGTANTDGAANNSVYVTDQIAGSFAVVTTGSYVGTTNLVDTATTGAGALTIGGATNTGDGGTIILTEASGGGVTVSGPLGSSTTGAITINAGSGSVTFTNSAQNIATNDAVTITDGSAVDIQSAVTVTGTSLGAGANGIKVDNGGTLSWGSPTTISGPTTVGGTVSGTLAPIAGTYATLNTGNLTLNSTATTGFNVSATAVSTIAVTGTATLGGNLQVNISGDYTVGQTFTLLSATSTISGNFANASSISSGPYVLSASVSGNSVILTVTSVATFDVAGGVVTFLTSSASPNVTVTISGSNYIINDPDDTIVPDTNASNAGWTASGSHIVTGPTSGISTITIETVSGSSVNYGGITGGSANIDLVGSNESLTFSGAVTTSGNVVISGSGTGTLNGSVSVTGNLTLSGYSTIDFEGNTSSTNTISTSGTFTISGVTTIADGLTGHADTLNAANVAITGTSTALDFEGNLSATGNITVSGVTNITDGTAGAPGTLAGATLSLTSTTGIGTATSPVLTAGATIIANSGASGVYISQTGSSNFSGSVTGAGILDFTDPNAGDTTTINATLSAGTGGIYNGNPGNIYDGNTYAILLSAAGSIVDNANITASGPISIAADSGGTGTGSFTQAITGATITTSNTGANALTITVNTAGGGTGNASIRTIADSGTLNIDTNGGDVLYAGTDTYSASVTTITEAVGSNVATITPGTSITASAGSPAGATGFYAGEQVTITGTGGVFDGTYIVQTVNSSGAVDTAEPTFTITTATAATSPLSVSAGTISAPNGVMEAQSLGVVGSDGIGSGPTGEVVALNYNFTATGNGSVGTATRPIQTDSPSGNTFTLNAGNGGLYVVDWGSPIFVTGATATGVGNVVVVAANASGHNLTLEGDASTGSGNILIAADDELVIDQSVTIGGSSFSGQVYLGANRDQENDQDLLDEGTIITSNTSVYNNTGIPLTSTPGAVLLEDYDATGTLAGAMELGSITVGTGGSITATTDATLGIYDVSTGTYSTPGGQGSEDIVPFLAGDSLQVLDAPNGTVNLFADIQSGSTTTGGIGDAADAPIFVSAANVNVIDNTGGTSNTNGVENNSVYVNDQVPGTFTAVSEGSYVGTINLADTATGAGVSPLAEPRARAVAAPSISRILPEAASLSVPRSASRPPAPSLSTPPVSFSITAHSPSSRMMLSRSPTVARRMSSPISPFRARSLLGGAKVFW